MGILSADTGTAEEIKTEVETALDEQSHVYVKCHLPPAFAGIGVRIWRSTFLIDHGSANQSKLVHAEGISYYPLWTFPERGKSFSFLLIFEGLPKTCTVFDLIEKIPENGGFEVRGILRNERDVYWVEI